LREEAESCVGVAKGSGTWPKIAGTKEERKGGLPFPKINLKYCITKGHLLICDWLIGYSKSSKK